MNKANNDIRQAIKDADLRYYMVANAYGIADSTFTRILRYELSSEKKAKLLAIIKDLKK